MFYDTMGKIISSIQTDINTITHPLADIFKEWSVPHKWIFLITKAFHFEIK